VSGDEKGGEMCGLEMRSGKEEEVKKMKDVGLMEGRFK
jgi:hypothetical protein